MVDIDEQLAIGNARPDGAKSFETRRVGRNDAVKLHSALRLLNNLRRIQKFVFLWHGVFVPAPDFFAFVFQGHREAELRPDTISVGPDVADDAKGLALADTFDDPVN